jgi:predicted MFS family arabinose efflux permease
MTPIGCPMMALPRSVVLLSACQAVFVTGTTMVVSMTALVGLSLAPDPRLATVPAALLSLTAMATAMPMSLLMKRIGRRRGFVGGVIVGAAGATLAAAAINQGSFVLFCVGSACLGVMSGTAQYYRFAAADAVVTAEQPRAISLVLAGGLAAAFAGPNLARWTHLAVPDQPFMASFAALALLQTLTLGLLSQVEIPRPSIDDREAVGRSLAALARQPRYALAVLAAVVAYGTMNVLMMATPLAMSGHGFHFGATASVIQWHAVGMFAPAFFTGRLVQRRGSSPIIVAGALLLLVSATTSLLGHSIWNYWVALASLGVGWNLLFVAASALLTRTYSEAEKARAQGLNDLLVFGTVSMTALLSGSLYQAIGWRMMNWLVMVPLVGLIVACFALDRPIAAPVPARESGGP